MTWKEVCALKVGNIVSGCGEFFLVEEIRPPHAQQFEDTRIYLPPRLKSLEPRGVRHPSPTTMSWEQLRRVA